jgi:hypothetical protein
LDKKHNLNAEKAHDAGYDTLCCHYLFEELRQLSDVDSMQELTPIQNSVNS